MTIIIILILSYHLWNMLFYHPGTMLSIISFNILTNPIIIPFLQIKNPRSSEVTWLFQRHWWLQLRDCETKWINPTVLLWGVSRTECVFVKEIIQETLFIHLRSKSRSWRGEKKPQRLPKSSVIKWEKMNIHTSGALLCFLCFFK